MRVGALAGSPGLNLYLIIDKANRVEKQKDYLREQINLLKTNSHYLELFMQGAKTQGELDALLKHYSLEADSKNSEELNQGVEGLLGNYNKNLADCLRFVDETFGQLDEDAVTVTAEDKAEQEAIRRDRIKCKDAVDGIQADKNGETRKEKIVKFSDLTRDTLVKRFDEWIAALDAILEVEKIRALVAQEAVFLVEDLIDLPPAKWPEKIARQGARTFKSVDAAFQNRKVFLKEEDVTLLLSHFVEELTKQTQAA
jgi:hypothetical protein